MDRIKRRRPGRPITGKKPVVFDKVVVWKSTKDKIRIRALTENISMAQYVDKIVEKDN